MNYQIKSNLPVSGSHWGLLFRDGVAVTEKRDLAERLKERGYEVSEAVDDVVSVAAAAEDKTVDAVEAVAVDVEQEKFICPKCGKEYKNETSFKKHVEKCEAE